MADSDYLFKIILVGDTVVGKSVLILQFVEDEGPCTMPGIIFRTKRVTIDGKTINLQLWDTVSGLEKFRTINSCYYRGADGILLVYDVTNSSTFEHLDQWLEDIDAHAPQGVTKMLVGNKADLASKKQVEFETAKAYADQKGIPLMETCTGDNTSVEQVFMAIAAQIKNRKYPLDEVASSEAGVVDVSSRTGATAHAPKVGGDRGRCVLN